MPQHKAVPGLLVITLSRIEKLVTRLVLDSARDIANTVCSTKEANHEDIIEQTRKITNQHVEEVREMIFGHVVRTLHQDVTLHILKENDDSAKQAGAELYQAQVSLSSNFSLAISFPATAAVVFFKGSRND